MSCISTDCANDFSLPLIDFIVQRHIVSQCKNFPSTFEIADFDSNSGSLCRLSENIFTNVNSQCISTSSPSPECEGDDDSVEIIEIVTKVTVVEVTASLSIDFGDSVTIPDLSGSVEDPAAVTFLNILKETLLITATGGNDAENKEVRINSINGVAVSSNRKLASGGQLDIDFTIIGKVECVVTEEQSCSDEDMADAAEAQYVAAASMISETTPESLGQNLQKAVENVEEEGLIAAGDMAMLDSIYFAADDIAVEVSEIPEFDRESVTIEEVVERVPVENDDVVDDDGEVDDDSTPVFQAGAHWISPQLLVSAAIGIAAAVAAPIFTSVG
jgi:hypothetical protein